MSGFGNPKLGRVCIRNHAQEMTSVLPSLCPPCYASTFRSRFWTLDLGLWNVVGGWRLAAI
jgi:hypothetical protein